MEEELQDCSPPLKRLETALLLLVTMNSTEIISFAPGLPLSLPPHGSQQ